MANHALIEMIAKAYHWQEQLESGKYACLEDLAKNLELDRSYVGRMLRLALILLPHQAKMLRQWNRQACGCVCLLVAAEHWLSIVQKVVLAIGG